jgi:hypothetical protein
MPQPVMSFVLVVARGIFARAARVPEEDTETSRLDIELARRRYRVTRVES